MVKGTAAGQGRILLSIEQVDKQNSGATSSFLGDFTVQLLMKPDQSDACNDTDTINQALRAMGSFGGLGAKARKGQGSLLLTRLNDSNVDNSIVGHLQRAESLLNTANAAGAYPPFSALSTHSRHQLLQSRGKPMVFDSADAALEKLRNIYRSAQYAAGTEPGPWIFGLPLRDHDSRNRRASPVFLHIHQATEDSYLAGALAMPAWFHPAAQYQRLGNEKLYRPINAFMDRLDTA